LGRPKARFLSYSVRRDTDSTLDTDQIRSDQGADQKGPADQKKLQEGTAQVFLVIVICVQVIGRKARGKEATRKTETSVDR
jgi:hypothetical protein